MSSQAKIASYAKIFDKTSLKMPVLWFSDIVFGFPDKAIVEHLAYNYFYHIHVNPLYPTLGNASALSMEHVSS